MHACMYTFMKYITNGRVLFGALVRCFGALKAFMLCLFGYSDQMQRREEYSVRHLMYSCSVEAVHQIYPAPFALRAMLMKQSGMNTKIHFCIYIFIEFLEISGKCA